jgi:hypothetical protein
MIDFTASVTALMRDLIARVPELSHIDAGQVLTFARHGATASAGPFATCHCLTLPTSEPGYYYWLDRCTGEMTRRSPYFVTESPTVTIAGKPIRYLISFALPRFCDQSLSRAPKRVFYADMPDWVAKLDTIVHELYHIAPDGHGLRAARHADGREMVRMHDRHFHREVAGMVQWYLASAADPELRAFLECDFDGLVKRHDRVVATTFRTFPSFPQRYAVPLAVQPPVPTCSRIQPLRRRCLPTAYTERDLVVRAFLADRQIADRRLEKRAPGLTRRSTAAASVMVAAAGNQR